MNDVAVFHPGLQHSHQLALALHEHGRLKLFCSAVPILSTDEPLPWWLPAKLSRRIKRVAIPAELRCHPVPFYAGVRAARLSTSAASQSDLTHRMFHMFDWWASRKVLKLRPRVVVAYENSAMHTFEAARQIGARCILDLPSIHHEAAASLLDTPRTSYESEINRRKDIEVESADLIITCSNLAAETYLRRGVPTDKVRSILLGASLPSSVQQPAPVENETLTFVFAGSFSHRKSGDHLIEVFRRLELEKIAIRFYLVGGVAEHDLLEQLQNISTVTLVGQVSQPQLFATLRAADCLILPSRFDAFGMVAIEALACGTPVIVSSQTGAKEVVQLFPGCGWIVEANPQSIYECILARYLDRSTLRAARASALAAATSFTWERYRSRVGMLITDWLGGDRDATSRLDP